MIPKNQRPGAFGENLGDGESRAFTIQANGTAFKTLIDGLYSNKVRAVLRELCSNAQDSHIDAGNPAPFKVSIPTNLDPTFRIRDYGTSLSHDDMMVLYTTIFQSTKTGTNEQTGQLGLGSKSPFAYTDSFTVVAYMDGQKRSYLAYLAEDGVPSLKFMGTSATDEPQGLEVIFAAKRDDIYNFQREMQFVAMGYSTPPEVEGMRIKLQPPRMRGSNWAVYPRGAFGDEVRGNHFIRMGSAIYPYDKEFPGLGYSWLSVVEIPIGTAAVTASREALSYDHETRQAIQAVYQTAAIELKAQVDAVVAAAKSRRERALVYKEYNGLLTNMRGSASVPLWQDEQRGTTGLIPGDVLEQAEHFGKSQTTRGAYNRYASQFEVHHLDQMIVLVNDEEVKTVRRVKRIREMARSRGLVYVLDEPIRDIDITGVVTVRRAPAITWIKKCLELKDSQFVLVSSLPDCPPQKHNARPKKPPRVLKPGQFWMSRQEGRVNSSLFGQSERGYGEWPKTMQRAMVQAGFSPSKIWDDIFWVTERQEEAYTKKGQLPLDRKLDVTVKEAIEKAVAAAPLDDAQTLQTILQMVGEYNKALPVVLDKFFPTLSITRDDATAVLNLAELAKIDLRNRPIVAKINQKIQKLIGQYPLLFQRSDRSHFEQYVTAIQASKKEEVAK